MTMEPTKVPSVAEANAVMAVLVHIELYDGEEIAYYGHTLYEAVIYLENFYILYKNLGHKDHPRKLPGSAADLWNKLLRASQPHSKEFPAGLSDDCDYVPGFEITIQPRKKLSLKLAGELYSELIGWCYAFPIPRVL